MNPARMGEDVAGPYRLRDYTFSIAMDPGPWVPLVRRCFGYLEATAGTSFPIARYQVRREVTPAGVPEAPGGDDVLLIAPATMDEAPLCISLAGREGYTRLAEVFFTVGEDYLGAMLAFFRDHLHGQTLHNIAASPPIFHAATFAAGPRTLWLAGLSEAGKTTQTLSLLLTRPDVRVLADDLVLIDRDRRALLPYLLPLRLLPSTLSLLERLGLPVPEAWRARQFCAPPRTQVWQGGPRTPTTLVVLARGATTTARPLSEIDALHLLLRYGDILRFPDGVAVLQEMIAGCVTRVELLVGSMLDGTAALSALLDGVALADLPARAPGVAVLP